MSVTGGHQPTRALVCLSLFGWERIVGKIGWFGRQQPFRFVNPGERPGAVLLVVSSARLSFLEFPMSKHGKTSGGGAKLVTGGEAGLAIHCE